MITKECVTSIWRFYPQGVTPEQAANHTADFTGVLVMVYLTETKAFVKGMLAEFNLSAKRDFIQQCVDDGLEVIQMERAGTRNMPFARRIDDHHEIPVDTLVKHYGRNVPFNRRKADNGS